MTVQKHTPGPWTAGDDGWIDSPTDSIAEIMDYGFSDLAQANANLIAAAPDLLEAAEAALEDRIGWRRMMRAALAKARGE